jgi:hypothetical protein
MPPTPPSAPKDPWSAKIGPGPRPWTDAGLAYALEHTHSPSGRPVYYADSAARDQLARALVRYIRREVSGASYLLAADRGTGKTTTFEWVVQQLYAECVAEQSPYLGHRPLLVRLYGPNLAPIRDPPPGLTSEATTHRAPADDDPPYAPVLQLLRDMAVSLFEAVLSEIERTIRLRLPKTTNQPTRTGDDDLELFLQLRHEMRRGPVIADLVAYWDRLGWGRRGAFSREPDHRGAAEVSVLQDLAEARLAVVSKAEDKRGSKQALEAEQERKSTIQPTDLLRTSTAIIAGAAVAAGLAVQGDWILAGITAPLVTAGVGASLTLSSRFARRQSQQDERAYTLKADVESLIHRLPRLLQGLRQVGLHPVFVVDELDKVDPELVTYLVNNLKTQVTDQSFFCFLTDNASANAAEPLGAKPRYLAHSLFWDHIYLFQTTPALHGYLQVFLAEEEATPGIQREAVAVLRHILLLRAEHNTLRLHRALDQILHEGFYARIDENPQGFVRDPAIRLRLRFALAIEWAMAELVTEINHEPRRLQLAKDVLYRPWRSWRDNEERCTVTRLGVYQEVRDATGDRDFAGHVARAVDTLLEQLAAPGFSSARAPDDARTRAYRGVQCPPMRLASGPVTVDATKRVVEAHVHEGPLLDRESGRWLERPPIVQELDIEHRLQQLGSLSCVEQVGGLEACVDLLFDETPSRTAIVQRAQDVIAVAFLARVLAASLGQPVNEALDAVGLLVEGTVRIPHETLAQLGRHLHIEALDDLVEAADAATLESRLKSRGPLSPEVLAELRQAWLDDWLRRLTSPWNADDRGSVLDPVAELRRWPRRALWRWRMPTQPEPERSIALWSDIVHEAFGQQLPALFGVLALDRLGFVLRPEMVSHALEAYFDARTSRSPVTEADPAGTAPGPGASEPLSSRTALRARVAELLQRRGTPARRPMVLETAADGAGESWTLDDTVPALLLDTDRKDATATLLWITEQLQAPGDAPAPSRVLRFGRMDTRRVSAPEGLAAYVLGPGQLRLPKSPPGLVISDPGSPRALLAALAQAGVDDE